MAHPHAQHDAGIARLTVPLTDLYCLCCAEELESSLRSHLYIAGARVDVHARTAEISYHNGMIDEAGVRALIDDSGRCRCAPGETGAAAAPSREAPRPDPHLAHRAQMAEITLGGAHDHMQHE